ncbi:hypothetical protein HJB51_23640 [Rhizobium lentis]|uniref:Uncharacterized protein n=1 Tax=Rhizobium lentis TaxID=1138194 RepID=A0A9Q3M7K6_9HYPH|nr:hypothetical protein [Rhizobium lentis]MBX4996433.1 hypothetical protein [Rhizobium lentis]MBX5009310.1 hypothetical protein [Rhizobium lentis]MBX5016201.1 hypothetical protein [Rhizobium lentis]MBX5021715.1 hypothetical protein [Rhizobium lentis]MBX5043373.1 hypothetical protein [Rhizobium lentis]
MHTRTAGMVFKKLAVLSRRGSYSSCRQLVLVVYYFSAIISKRYFSAAIPAAASKLRREIMERSRPISFVILAFMLLAGGAFLLEHTGLFAGALRTEILARVDEGEVVKATGIQK